MNATDELRKMLDKRCVEWSEYGDGYTEFCVRDVVDSERRDIDIKHYTVQPNVAGTLIVAGLTPQQAIAATLGQGVCHRRPHINLTIGDDFLKQSGWDCSECGCRLDLPVIARYCPNCGRKVVDG